MANEYDDLRQLKDQAQGDFATEIDYAYQTRRGLGEDIVREISAVKGEPQWMLDFRLKALDTFMKLPMPTWGADLGLLNFEEFYYFMRSTERKARTWEEVPGAIKDTFERLGIPEAERRYLAGVETQMDSEAVYSSLKAEWEQHGIIFVDMDTAVREYPDLVREHISTVVPIGDNKFAALNSAFWSGGSFVYVPQGVNVEIPLQAYFRINAQNLGQFERTIIIADEGSNVHYIEGCFLAGARVRTSQGEKNIEEIRPADQVLTHQGRWRSVYHTMRRPYSGKIYTLRYYGDSSQALRVTEEHPLLVVKRQRRRERNKVFEPQWLPAAEVAVGDYVVIPVRKPVQRQAAPAVMVTVRPQGARDPIPRQVIFPQEPDFYRLLGYYFAEGHISNEHYLTLSFSAQETEYLADAEALLTRYGQKSPLTNAEYQGGRTLVLCSTELARAFAYEFGSTIADKHVPDWVLDAEPELLKAFVGGLWRGGGSYDAHKNMFRFSSISRNIAYAFRDALLRLGIAASVNFSQRRPPRQPMYTIVIASPYNAMFGAFVGQAAPAGQWGGSPFHIDENYLYVPIRSVSVEEMETEVYNFSVEQDESYVCEGVVSHNCTAPQYSTWALHTGVIEIFVKKGAHARYTTIQNWSRNVYNLVTQRAVVEEEGSMTWVDGNLGCLTGDAMVLLAGGVKPISEVEPGEWVYAVNADLEWGRYPVVAKKCNGPQLVFRLQTENYRTLRATANHPFLTLTSERNTFALTWKRLDQLQVNDWIAISGDLPDDGVERHFGFTSQRGVKKLNFPPVSSEDLLWLLGIYIGDGYMDTERVYFAVPPADKAHPRLLQVLKNLFGVDYTIRGSVIRINSVQLCDWFKYLGFEGTASEKRIPRWIYTLPRSQRFAFIQGYIDADGYRRENHKNISITSVNQVLLEEVKQLALSCGLDARKISRWTRREKKPLGIEEKEYTHYFLYFGEHKSDHAVYFRRVTAIEACGTEDTWDLEISGAHNFVANGIIVHNSGITMKYPAVVLRGPRARGEVLSIAFAGDGQHYDAGAKAIHLAPHTTSLITSKSISKGLGRSGFRGLVRVVPGAIGAQSKVTCDALLLDPESRSDTYPYIDVSEDEAQIEHEATVSKISEDQLFYLMSRGLSEKEASAMIVNGFLEPFVKELPMEYAVELNRLIALQMEGTVG